MTHQTKKIISMTIDLGGDIHAWQPACELGPLIGVSAKKASAVLASAVLKGSQAAGYSIERRLAGPDDDTPPGTQYVYRVVREGRSAVAEVLRTGRPPQPAPAEAEPESDWRSFDQRLEDLANELRAEIEWTRRMYAKDLRLIREAIASLREDATDAQLSAPAEVGAPTPDLHAFRAWVWEYVASAVTDPRAAEAVALLRKSYEERFDEARARLGVGAGRPRPVLGELSAEAKAARAPLPPEELVEAKHDRVHRDPGRVGAARTVRNSRRGTTSSEEAP